MQLQLPLNPNLADARLTSAHRQYTQRDAKAARVRRNRPALEQAYLSCHALMKSLTFEQALASAAVRIALERIAGIHSRRRLS